MSNEDRFNQLWDEENSSVSKQDETEDPEVKDPEELEKLEKEYREKQRQEKEIVQANRKSRIAPKPRDICPWCGKESRGWIVDKKGEYFCALCETGYFSGKEMVKREIINVPGTIPGPARPVIPEKIDPSRICPSCKGIDTLRSDQAFPSVHVCANCGVYV